MTSTPAAFEIGWYGKLPGAGDFVSRRVPRPLLETLDLWLTAGLAELRAQLPERWRTTFAGAPVWNCAIPGRVTGGTTLVGLIAPSRDRVGREFPLCAGVALPAGVPARPLLEVAHGWLGELGRTVVLARDRALALEAFDEAVQSIPLPLPAVVHAGSGGVGDILAILGDAADAEDVPTVPMPLAYALPWPELPEVFDAASDVSYWWTNSAAGSPLRGFTTESGLASALFVTLMRPLPGHEARGA